MPSGSAIVLRNSAEADIPTPDTGQVAIFNDADDSNTPAYKDEAGIVTSLRGADGADGELTYQDHGNTGSTETVDASTANVHRLVLNAATVTLTLTGAPTAGTPGLVRLFLIQDGTGGRLMSWPGSVSWVTGVAPTLSMGAGAVDVIDLETQDGGTTWYGIMVGQRGATGATGAAGTNGTNGTNGTTGGAIAIDYTFSTTTTDSDPGDGNLRLDNATQNTATTIRADLKSSDGTTWTSVLDTFADASNTVKGHIRLFKKSDPTKWLVFTVSAIASPSGYRNITVANVGSSAASPFSNGDAIVLTFTRSGDQGSTVGSGTLTTVEEVDGSPTDSAVTKLVVPNGTLGIASHVATYTPAYPAITTTDAPCTADTSIASTSTYTDVTGCSASLAAGTWMALADVQFNDVAGGAHYVGARITDGTTDYGLKVNIVNGATGAWWEMSVTSKPIVLGSTTTVKLQVASASAATTVARRAGTLNPNTLDSTHITFIRVA